MCASQWEIVWQAKSQFVSLSPKGGKNQWDWFDEKRLTATLSIQSDRGWDCWPIDYYLRSMKLYCQEQDILRSRSLHQLYKNALATCWWNYTAAIACASPDRFCSWEGGAWGQALLLASQNRGIVYDVCPLSASHTVLIQQTLHPTHASKHIWFLDLPDGRAVFSWKPSATGTCTHGLLRI